MKYKAPKSDTKRGGKASSVAKRPRRTNSSSPKRGSQNADGWTLQLYGIHTVREALGNRRRKLRRLQVSANALPRLEDALRAAPAGLVVEEVAPRALDRLVGADAVHQGAVLECDPLPALGLDAIEPGELIVILDQISDPHNVGAIIRSCVAFNAGSLIITSRNSAAQTAVLAKSASGALEHIKLIEVSNLSKAIGELNEMGYQTIGLDSEGPQEMERSFDSRPAAIVLGAEGKGMRQKTRETCTTLARLDMPGRIKSLNVSNAAALALYVTSNRSS